MPEPTASHGEKMDRIYRHQRFIYDLTRRYYLLGRDQLIAGLLVPPGRNVLEVGCGTGRNLIATARRYPGAHVFGIDISSVMLDTARRNIDRAGLSARISVALADATSMDPGSLFGVDALDQIFCSYVLSMIPRWPDVIVNSIGMLAENGTMHIVDFGDFGRCPQAFAAAMHGWLRRFHVHPIADFETSLAVLCHQHGLLLQVSSPFRRYAVQASLTRRAAIDAHMTHREGRHPIVISA